MPEVEVDRCKTCSRRHIKDKYGRQFCNNEKCSEYMIKIFGDFKVD